MKNKSSRSLKVLKKPNHKKQIFRLRVSLNDVDPEVYRILLVPGTFHLGQLHMLIQMSFGWNNSHLHEFVIGTKDYIDYDFDEGDPFGKPKFDEKKCVLGSTLNAGQIFTYDYDFGDNWTHCIKVLSIEEPMPRFEYPACIEGKNACPPDDCGGANGYEELKEYLQSDDSEIRGPAMMYVGGQFDPFTCDPNRVNRDMIWRYDW